MSLPGSPFHRRLSRSSNTGSHSYSLRSGPRFGERRQWLRSSYLDTRDHLPYVDDSRVGSPNGSLDGQVIHLSQGWPGLGPHSRHNSYSSHTSRITYNSHAELTASWRPERGHGIMMPPTRWSHWVEGFNTNNDVPYPSNGHNGNMVSLKEVIKSSMANPSDSCTPNKQRLSVQFPVCILSFAEVPFIAIYYFSNFY